MYCEHYRKKKLMGKKAQDTRARYFYIESSVLGRWRRH
jgi:hypothetical protein